MTLPVQAEQTIATADDSVEVPTVVRLPKCGPEAGVSTECKCMPGTVACLDRRSVDLVIAVVASEAACREDLSACREMSPPPPVESGWDPGIVLGVAAGVVIAVAAVAFAGGYLVGR